MEVGHVLIAFIKDQQLIILTSQKPAMLTNPWKSKTTDYLDWLLVATVALFHGHFNHISYDWSVGLYSSATALDGFFYLFSISPTYVPVQLLHWSFIYEFSVAATMGGTHIHVQIMLSLLLVF
ncbi:hypothetical protein L6452_12763 [Arctium lappa]|uniref:Uncharacterized protein n=1 Tax=Arctium lappa TaxID=4217 RepID=A0ACB9CGA9_ARCLA|nr:hypothetical protein L6452_12763 [Arctium lappa]